MASKRLVNHDKKVVIALTENSERFAINGLRIASLYACPEIQLLYHVLGDSLFDG